MTDLRTRIEQRITDLRVERDIAAAATPGPWHMCATTVGAGESCGDLPDIASCGGDVERGMDNATHIATQDPATTIARTDRELAVCAADLALLDWMERPVQVNTPSRWDGYALANLEARYPE